MTFFPLPGARLGHRGIRRDRSDGGHHPRRSCRLLARPVEGASHYTGNQS
jgi:hypothetical protein